MISSILSFHYRSYVGKSTRNNSSIGYLHFWLFRYKGLISYRWPQTQKDSPTNDRSLHADEGLNFLLSMPSSHREDTDRANSKIFRM